MNYLILLTLAVSATLIEGMARPTKEPLIGGIEHMDPAKYQQHAWNYTTDINEKANGSSYLIPIKVIDVASQPQITTFSILMGESTCVKGGPVQVADISAANCQLKPEGKQSLWSVRDFFRPWKTPPHNITASKLRDVEAGEVFTTTEDPYNKKEPMEPITYITREQFQELVDSGRLAILE